MKLLLEPVPGAAHNRPRHTTETLQMSAFRNEEYSAIH